MLLEQLADGLLFAPLVDSLKTTSHGAYKQKHILFVFFNNTQVAIMHGSHQKDFEAM